MLIPKQVLEANVGEDERSVQSTTNSKLPRRLMLLRVNFNRRPQNARMIDKLVGGMHFLQIYAGV